MTVHEFRLNPGSVTQGTCTCGNWDGHTDNHHLHARTRNGHNMKRQADYLQQAKDIIRGGDPQLAVPYTLIAIAETLQAASTASLAAAAQAGAEAPVTAISTVMSITEGN